MICMNDGRLAHLIDNYVELIRFALAYLEIFDNPERTLLNRVELNHVDFGKSVLTVQTTSDST